MPAPGTSSPSNGIRLSGLVCQPFLDPPPGFFGGDVLDPGHDGPAVPVGVHDHPEAVPGDERRRFGDRCRASLDRTLADVVDVGAVDHGRVADTPGGLRGGEPQLRGRVAELKAPGPEVQLGMRTRAIRAIGPADHRRPEHRAVEIDGPRGSVDDEERGEGGVAGRHAAHAPGRAPGAGVIGHVGAPAYAGGVASCNNPPSAGLSPTATTKGIMRPGQAAQHFALRRFDPGSAVARYAENYWSVRWDLTGRPAYRQELIPHPCVNVSVDPARPARCTGGSRCPRRCCMAW